MALESLSYHFESAGLPAASVVVQEMKLEEALDETYLLELELHFDDAATDVAQMLGRDATFRVARAPLAREVRGVVRAVREGQRTSSGGLDTVVEVVPAAFMLSLRRNTRMFQNQAVPDILSTVIEEGLGPYGREVQLDLDKAAYPVREYALQYQESDLDFVQRLMEEEGIHYSFDHVGEVEVMVLRDSNRSAEPVDVVNPGAIPYSPNSAEVREEEPILRFERDHRPSATAVTLRDFDWTRGHRIVEHTVDGEDELGRSRESYEHGWARSLTIGDYAGTSYTADDAERQSEVRHQAHAARSLLGHGISRVIGLQPGRRFRLDGHPTVGVDDEYLVTRVVHESRAARELGVSGRGEPHHNRFQCVPFSVPYRPERDTEKPRIPSIQTAVVTGPPGEEIHVDEHGRVTVQFHWDRENPANETSSTWIRVQQKWAGTGWGSMWIPRVGGEVIVQFVDGDPDRPVITGSLYNANNPLPYDLPGDKTKSTIKSNSTPGGGGFNEIRFEDRAGAEEIYIHSQKDTNRVTLNNETNTVGANQTVTIGANQTQSIGANQTESIGANQTDTVGASRTVTVGGTLVESIGASSTITVGGHATETLNAGETQTVNAGRTETVNGGETRTVNGGQTETVNGGVTQTVNGSVTQTVAGSVTETFTGAHTNTTGASLTHTVTGGITLVSPAGVTLIAGGGYNLLAPPGALDVTGGTNGVFSGGGQLVLAANTSRTTGTHTELNLINLTLQGVSLGLYGTHNTNAFLELSLAGIHLFAIGAHLEKVNFHIRVGGLQATIHGPKFGTSGIHIYI